MYDVVYLDRTQRQTLVAAGLSGDAARDLACEEAKRRNVGRMFLAGSQQTPTGELVLIVESAARAA
jgi:hypothetical protein